MPFDEDRPRRQLKQRLESYVVEAVQEIAEQCLDPKAYEELTQVRHDLEGICQVLGWSINRILIPSLQDAWNGRKVDAAPPAAQSRAALLDAYKDLSMAFGHATVAWEASPSYRPEGQSAKMADIYAQIVATRQRIDHQAQ